MQFEYAAPAEIVRVFPVAPGTGRTPIRSPASRLTCVAFVRWPRGGRLLDLVVAGGVGIEDLR